MVSDALAGVFRSLRIYHGPAASRAAMDALYSRFVKAGDVVFDIGAHVGDRVSSFRRLGARVVAVEPQPLLVCALRHIHGVDKNVMILPFAAGAEDGEQVLKINTHNPTVSTLSDAFPRDAAGAIGWEGQSWDASTVVPTITLDRLIGRFGVPAFIKIDVEGYEDEVLAGLSHPVRGLSFEWTAIARDVATRAVERLSALGHYSYDMALGESQQLTFKRWTGVNDILHHLAQLPPEANSGDVYARLDQAD